MGVWPIASIKFQGLGKSMSWAKTGGPISAGDSIDNGADAYLSVLYGGAHTGATWRIRLNRPCAAAMRPICRIIFDHLLVF